MVKMPFAPVAGDFHREDEGHLSHVPSFYTCTSASTFRKGRRSVKQMYIVDVEGDKEDNTFLVF